jgi:hypothetical protein
MVTPEELPGLLRTAAALGVELEQQEEPAPDAAALEPAAEGDEPQVEAARQALEDLFNMY